MVVCLLAMPVQADQGAIGLGWLTAPLPGNGSAVPPAGRALISTRPAQGLIAARAAQSLIAARPARGLASLPPARGLTTEARALFSASAPDDGAVVERPAGSLFRADSRMMKAAFQAGPGRIAAALRDLIASVEADGRGYDTIHQSATRLPEKKPSQMTLSEIRAWIRATPGQQHAIGRYQVIPKTLDMLAERLGLPPNTRYSPAVQDRMADALMEDAGLSDLVAGRLGREAFLDGLARIWAGLPVASGKSAYHGLAGNRAVISRTSFRDRVDGIVAE